MESANLLLNVAFLMPMIVSLGLVIFFIHWNSLEFQGGNKSEIQALELKTTEQNQPQGKYSGFKRIQQGSMRELAADLNPEHIWEGPEEPAASDCPKGRYRGNNKGTGEATTNWDFETAMGCILCPRGKYGATTGLTSAACTFPCPKGRYGYRAGATSEDDCWHCPPGTYGSSTGLTDATCSGSCPVGKYSKEW
eukprot:CAMPEP_0117737522 /NCGR_PEP_ID=MMETSP0947-20121206/2585_1 /TAXON_ID=44440 /ORGANISM="Chattonella subsalsa, Strain CCMP2191" /LENGTH=193 /DNA_ID=CAMNT_0005553039 /DNA_START=96 /DNA_END=674 /DNA_ORIENTATION=+